MAISRRLPGTPKTKLRRRARAAPRDGEDGEEREDARGAEDESPDAAGEVAQAQGRDEAHAVAAEVVVVEHGASRLQDEVAPRGSHRSERDDATATGVMPRHDAVLSQDSGEHALLRDLGGGRRGRRCETACPATGRRTGGFWGTCGCG